MPRLVGKRSHTGENITVFITFVAIAGVLLEYFGVIHIVPGFDRDRRNFELQSYPTNEQSIEQTHQ
ncbi:hypothetical protein G7B40_034900 [Aetokthonos hydrillicola Thurmond2011]|uniref:Uncharacterized protein n=1 Tax=Aetokthonos hydrillicola Thurmond2011 TaxID=2712845 RepID=A0AAP5IDK7_9CYAN|nr:hypothetical protein [Aetokthonos hydrillicola]MBO3463988.1 hypothetical protein [Aetokthonos hydrillicola CCALA 1050]MBW4591195.1 hypothetical protein [Aetokthonos hydrillicola CCALA 1050]MDR9899710.1 hypothetical protein [Aetokthonos hydrillicola Thurmond2011]